jgi:hypothetical protein
MKPNRRRLRIEPLEDRTVPTALGSAWPDATALNLSFAPDGTANGQVGSSLYRALGGLGPAAVWQREILRAFQTWAAVADVNVGLVRDGGQAFGAPGDIQGDTRFGDVRIGGIPLSADSLANTSPFSWAIGTWSGDVMLNAATRFAIRPASPADGSDLFSVALHEAGHTLGLPDSTDPASAMYTNYLGVRTGLSAADVAGVRANYGARADDRFEGPAGNGTLATATTLAADQTALYAVLRDDADADTYSFVNPAWSNSLSVQMRTSGVSLLVAKLSVYDAAGNLVGSATATDPTRGDLSVRVNQAIPGATYFVRVESASADVFGVGRYQLGITRGGVAPAYKDTFTKDGGTNDTPATATVLTPTQTGVSFTGNDFAYNGVLEGKADVDHYAVQAPTATDGTDVAMIVRLNNLQTGHVAPALAVTDAAGRPVPYQVLANDGTTLAVQVLGVTRGAGYVLQLASPANLTDATGNYRLTVNFQQPDGATFSRLVNGQLGGTSRSATGTLVVQNSRLFSFDLFASPAGGGSVTDPVTVTITDGRGATVLRLSQVPGGPLVSGGVYLTPGNYAVQVALGGTAGPTAPFVNYGLFAAAASDPVGPYPTNTGGTPTTDPTTGTTKFTTTTTDPASGTTTTTFTTGYFDAYFYDVTQTVHTIGYFYSF